MRRVPRETRRPPAAVLAIAGAGAVAAVAVAAGAVLTALVARAVVVPARRLVDDLPIRSSDADTVTLAATDETRVAGRYGLFFADGAGYALLGDPVERADSPPGSTVRRRVERVVRGDLHAARSGRWSGWYYLRPADLDVPFRDVEIDTELGPQAAWAIRAERPSRDWAVLVHGRGVTRAETLRAVPVLRSEGWNCLAITYRNDRGSLPSADGRYALGYREWADVDAALEWADAESGGRLLMAGWSMGGATVLQALSRTRLRDRILGVALDSPVIDWRDVLREQTRLRGLPPRIGRGAVRMIGTVRGSGVTGLAAPIDLDSLDWVSRASDLDHPVLIQHSRADRTVPSGPSQRLAELRPDAVTLELWDEAQHTRLWNYDPERWTRTIRTWLGSRG